MSQLTLTYLSLVMVSFLWGSNFVVVKILLEEMPPFAISTLRYSFATLALFALLYYTDRTKLKVDRADVPMLILLGFTGIFGFNALMYLGLNLSTAIKTSLIAAAMPIFVPLLSGLILRERLQGRQYFGMALSFVGALVVVLDGQLTRLVSLSFNSGDLLTLCAVLFFSLYSVLARSYMAKYGHLTVTAYACLFGSLFFVPMLLATVDSNPLVGLSAKGWLLLGYATIIVSFLTLQWWNQGIQRLSPSQSAVFVNLVPLFSVTMAFFVLGEPLIPAYLLGGMVIIGGVFVTTSTANFAKRLKGQFPSLGLNERYSHRG